MMKTRERKLAQTLQKKQDKDKKRKVREEKAESEKEEKLAKFQEFQEKETALITELQKREIVLGEKLEDNQYTYVLPRLPHIPGPVYFTSTLNF